MRFLIPRIIPASAEPKLRCSSLRWSKILDQLHRRTELSHESGAFLLGSIVGQRRRITRAIYYDQVDPHAYDTGICIVKGPGFAKLWEICRSSKLEVVADVHVHPGEASQSWSDRTNPVLPHAGHISIIVPHFARKPMPVSSLGIYQYESKYEWIDLGYNLARRNFHIGLFA